MDWELWVGCLLVGGCSSCVSRGCFRNVSRVSVGVLRREKYGPYSRYRLGLVRGGCEGRSLPLCAAFVVVVCWCGS